MVLALCVLVHLATLIYAVRGGLSAAEILGRTHGSSGWASFYALFVLAVAVHAPIGLDIGAITPQEIAVSILAELIAVKHGKVAGTDATIVSMRWDRALAEP